MDVRLAVCVLITFLGHLHSSTGNERCRLKVHDHDDLAGIYDYSQTQDRHSRCPEQVYKRKGSNTKLFAESHTWWFSSSSSCRTTRFSVRSDDWADLPQQVLKWVPGGNNDQLQVDCDSSVPETIEVFGVQNNANKIYEGRYQLEDWDNGRPTYKLEKSDSIELEYSSLGRGKWRFRQRYIYWGSVEAMSDAVYPTEVPSGTWSDKGLQLMDITHTTTTTLMYTHTTTTTLMYIAPTFHQDHPLMYGHRWMVYTLVAVFCALVASIVLCCAVRKYKGKSMATGPEGDMKLPVATIPNIYSTGPQGDTKLPATTIPNIYSTGPQGDTKLPVATIPNIYSI